MLKQCAPLHLIVTFSRIAFGGIPRRPSSRLSSRISLIASARLSNASSLLLPWPLAPGISGLYAMNHGPWTILFDDCCKFVCHQCALLPRNSLSQPEEERTVRVRLTACG